MLQSCRTRDTCIRPSILAIRDLPADALIEQCLRAAEAGAATVHMDVVGSGGRRTAVVDQGSDDTHAVFTPELVRALKSAGRCRQLPIAVDVHIMYESPTAAYLDAWLEAGADEIALHWEAYRDKGVLLSRLRHIRRAGTRTGIAVRPEANQRALLGFLAAHGELVSLVSQTGVRPCLGGQSMDYRILDTVSALAVFRERRNLSFSIMVDGGVEPEVSARRCLEAGADILAAGSTFFGGGRRDVETLRMAARALTAAAPPQEPDVYDIIARRIADRQRARANPLRVRVWGTHAGAVHSPVDSLRAGLRRIGCGSLVVQLDGTRRQGGRPAACARRVRCSACGSLIPRRARRR